MTGPEYFRSARLHDGGFAYGAQVAPHSLIYTAGLSPLDRHGAVVAAGDPLAQVDRVVECLDELLDERGAGRADIVKLTVYVATIDGEVLGAVWFALDAIFDGATPPAIVLGVSALPYPGQRVELEAVVALGVEPR
ncbi:RidA family protein [Gordonia neofelifaecis]|uniref:Endoribonuclease L-PSP n=1 Tax=Gordonia neofelifaecis NRRL B-59395 TaxID=644548 RepID=F1YLH6_9ACTN|nr:RidA family protein [Gordonia neofelifaecis]EGD54370.1 endoribonuclease L-PSP [Gordonia neofelifaecis NRRL B-59395]